MTRLTIALDTMSGDFGPRIVMPAALEALTAHPNLFLLLVGQPAEVDPFLKKVSPSILARLTVVPASSVIANDTKPSHAIRHSKDSSMRVALELVQHGQAQACVSAGNTGALMGLAKLLIKPLSGIERPALVSAIPNLNHGKTLVLDLGANVNCDSNMLVQFAVMGSVMAEEVFDIKTPRVALLNIGEEENKGLDNIQTAATILKEISRINYIGYLEGNDLLTGKTDVLVCDGFVGNVTLKTLEGVARVFISLLKSSDSTNKSWIVSLLGRWFQKRAAKRFGHLNPDQYNGACLLGLRNTVIKSHGAANQRAFVVAIEQAIHSVERDVPGRIAASLDAVLPKSD